MKKMCKLLAVCGISLFAFGLPGAEEPEITTEWLNTYFDKSGGSILSWGTAHFYNFMCLHCGAITRSTNGIFSKDREVLWDPKRPDELKCLKCGKITTKETCPPVRTEVKRRGKNQIVFEYHRPMNQTRGEYLLFPNLRRTKAEYAFHTLRRLADKAEKEKNPELAQKVLRGLVTYSSYYIDYMYDVRIFQAGGERFYLIVHFGYPLSPTHGRFWRFGDGSVLTMFCKAYQAVQRAGAKVSKRDYAICRNMAQTAITDVVMPCLRDRRGIGNSLGRLYSDCIYAARIFPDAHFRDWFEKDKKRKFLSSDDLVHEMFFGYTSISVLLDNYYYPNGLSHERTPAYHRMLQNGFLSMAEGFNGYRTPANYDPGKRGYGRITKDVLSYPNAARIANALDELVFPDHTLVPVGDSGNSPHKPKNPVIRKTTIEPNWGLGILRKGTGNNISCGVLSWGGNNVAHSHTDMLQIMYFADNRIMLSDTEYPHSGSHRAYHAMSAASHNCVLIDGANYKVTDTQDFSFYGESPLAGVMQAYTQQVYGDPGKTIRRTIVLVDSRPGKHPYLVDLAEVTGGKTYDLFIRGQAHFKDNLQSLKVLSPQLKPDSNPKNSLEDVLKYGKTAFYSKIASVSSGAMNGNAELLWTFPASPKGYHKTASSLRGILVADGKEQILTGVTSDGRRTFDINHMPELTMALRHREFQSPRNTRFFAVYEAVPDGGKPDLKQVRLLPGSRGVVVTHSAGEDLILIPEGAEKAEFSFAGKQGTFDGQALILSRGKTTRATAIGGTELAYAGKQHRTQPAIRGEVTDYPAGLAEFSGDESNAVITVSATIPASDVGNWMIIKNKIRPAAPWKIEKLEPLAGGKTRVTLDRSARRAIFIPEKIGDQGIAVGCATWMDESAAPGIPCKWGDQWSKILFYQPRRQNTSSWVVFDKAFDITPDMFQKKAILSNIGKGDSFVIYHTKEWTL